MIKAMFELAMDLSDDAIESDEYDAAIKALKLVGEFASRAKFKANDARIGERVKGLERLQE